MHIGKSAKPFQIIKENDETIKIINNNELEWLDLKVINGAFGKWIGLSINKPKTPTSDRPNLGSP